MSVDRVLERRPAAHTALDSLDDLRAAIGKREAGFLRYERGMTASVRLLAESVQMLVAQLEESRGPDRVRAANAVRIAKANVRRAKARALKAQDLTAAQIGVRLAQEEGRTDANGAPKPYSDAEDKAPARRVPNRLATSKRN